MLLQAMRRDLLHYVITSHDVERLPTKDDLLVIAEKLEGCMARDLCQLVKRALHANKIETGRT